MRNLLSLLAASLIPSLAFGQPIETVVWSGAKPAGQTWAHLGPKGKLAVEDGAGLDGGKGLVLHMDGEGYRGAGINWKGWYPPDSGNDTLGVHRPRLPHPAGDEGRRTPT